MNDRCAYNACTLAMEEDEDEVTGRQGGGDKRENEVSQKEIAIFLIFSLLEPCVHMHASVISDKDKIKEKMAFCFRLLPPNFA